jgi:hypothetical protein
MFTKKLKSKVKKKVTTKSFILNKTTEITITCNINCSLKHFFGHAIFILADRQQIKSLKYICLSMESTALD